METVRVECVPGTARVSGASLARAWSKIGAKFRRLESMCFERLLERKGSVRLGGRRVFTMRNYSWTTANRIRRFATKEPDTLRWIDSFAPDDAFMDIGANVGSFTLYAAARGIRTIAMEPDALNFALLNMNIQDNGFNRLAVAYPFSMHASPVIAELNMSYFAWGGAHKTFARAVDWQGADMRVAFVQGSAGMSVDEFLRQTGTNVAHIKIDVDGNESFVLQGARETLAHPALKSVLVELAPQHPEYALCIGALEGAGLVLQEKANAAREDREDRFVTENHIFVRPA